MATRCGRGKVRHRDPRGLRARVFLSILTSRAGARIWHRTISATRYTTRKCGRFGLCGGVGGGLSPMSRRIARISARMALRTRTVSRSRTSMFIGVSVGLKARLCSSARCRQLRPQNIGTHFFAPAASDGARPPLRSSHCHLTADRHPNSKTPCWLPSATNRTPGHRDDQIFTLKPSLRLHVDMNNIINLELRTFLLVFLFPTSVRTRATKSCLLRTSSVRHKDVGKNG